jgi:hypothetical protein
MKTRIRFTLDTGKNIIKGTGHVDTEDLPKATIEDAISCEVESFDDPQHCDHLQYIYGSSEYVGLFEGEFEVLK